MLARRSPKRPSRESAGRQDDRPPPGRARIPGPAQHRPTTSPRRWSPPVIGRARRAAQVPVRGRRADGRDGPVRPAVPPRSTAAWAATTSRCASRSRSSARVDQCVAITLEAGVSLGAMPIYRFGTEEQKQEWLPLLPPARRSPPSASPSPAGSDAGATRDHRATRRRRVGHQRHQGVHHQLGHRHHQAGHGHRGHRGPTAARRSRRSWCRPARRASPGRAGLQQGRLERLRTPTR